MRNSDEFNKFTISSKIFKLRLPPSSSSSSSSSSSTWSGVDLVQADLEPLLHHILLGCVFYVLGCFAQVIGLVSMDGIEHSERH